MEHVNTAVETGRMQQYAAVRTARVELALPATMEAKGTCSIHIQFDMPIYFMSSMLMTACLAACASEGEMPPLSSCKNRMQLQDDDAVKAITQGGLCCSSCSRMQL